ncbi:hypothetical protein [Micromonospora psammae]
MAMFQARVTSPATSSTAAPVAVSSRARRGSRSARVATSTRPVTSTA